MAALSSRFETARSTVAGTPRINDSSSSGLKVTPGPVAACALDRVRGDEVEADVLRLGRRLVAPRELDQLGDQRRHLRQLLGDVAQQCLPVRGGHGLVAREHLDVRAQAGQRRAQLVRRVGDELPLRPRRVLERAEHRVERRREPRELVGAGRVDAAREVARLRAPPRPSWSAAGRVRARPSRRPARARPRARSRRPTIRNRSTLIRSSAASTSSSGRAIWSASPGCRRGACRRGDACRRRARRRRTVDGSPGRRQARPLADRQVDGRLGGRIASPSAVTSCVIPAAPPKRSGGSVELRLARHRIGDRRAA